MAYLRAVATEHFPYFCDFFSAWEIAPNLPPAALRDQMTHNLTLAICQRSTANLATLTLDLEIPSAQQLNPTPFTITFNGAGEYQSYSNPNRRVLNLTEYEIAVLELAWEIKMAVDS